MNKKEQYQEALDRTIKAYNELIEEPELWREWEGYGQYTKCVLCKVNNVISIDDVRNGRCGECPIENENNKLIEDGIITGPSCINHSSWLAHLNSVNLVCGINEVAPTAMKRLNYIKELAIRNGYKVTTNKKGIDQ